MKRKYLDGVVINDRRPDRWDRHDPKLRKKYKKQRKKYGFDMRELWTMDCTFYCWLYERLKAFKEFSGIDLNYHSFEYEGKVYTQGEMIDEIIKRLKYLLGSNYEPFDAREKEYAEEIPLMWAEILPVMWC